MRKLICTVIAIVGICSAASAQTQEKWYVAPSASMAAIGANGAWAYGLTFGKYITKANDIRIDLQGNYLSMLEGNDYMTVSALAVTESKFDLFGWDKLYGSTGIGVGVLTPAGQSDARTDIVIPLKMTAEYRFAKNISFGLDVSYNFNTRSLKERSLYYTGAFLGFRF
jgi:hypothetical protein